MGGGDLRSNTAALVFTEIQDSFNTTYGSFAEVQGFSIEHGALWRKYTALLTEYRAFSRKYRALWTECRVFSKNIGLM